MRFQILHSTKPHIFYKVGAHGNEYHFMATTPLPPSDDLFVQNLDEAQSLKSNFYIGAVSKMGYSADHIGYLFYSTLPVYNLSTGILSASRSWQHSSKVSVTQDELLLILKTPHFYVYHALNKATLVTNPFLDDSLEDYLTMI
jgi:hypothetical protein